MIGRFMDPEHDKAMFEEAYRLVPQFEAIQAQTDTNTLIYSIHKQVDETLDKLGFWNNVSCKGKCSFCCHDTIYMPPLEAEYIKEQIEYNGIKPNQERKELQSSGKKLKWMEKACPYLEDENEEGNRLCSIYEVRPLICRTYNSTEDPKYCNKEEYPNKAVHNGKVIAIEAATYALMLMKSNKDKNGIPHMIPIHSL